VSLQRDLIRPDPQPLFDYTTSGAPQYLRMITLDTFDGTQWTQSAITSPADTNVDKGISPPAGVSLKPSATLQTAVTVTGLREPYLPVPGEPTLIKAHGDWEYNPGAAIVYSKHSSTLHLTYQVSSDVYSPSASSLAGTEIDPRDDAIKSYLAVPRGVPAQIKTEADAVLAAAGAVTPYEKAIALQNWFRTSFTYDLTVKTGSSANALESFLSDRRGYCQQFAATMALMARLEGIPARVDVGFLPGAKVANTDIYQVTTSDAHAWPELYFPGAGWLRFEPTPRSDEATTPPYANATAAVPGALPSSAATGPDIPGRNDNIPTARPAGGGLQHLAHGGGISVSRLPVGWLVVLLVVLVLVFAAPLVRWSRRRRRWTAADTEAARAHAAWAELGDDLRDLRLDWHGETDTPRRAAAALVATRRLQYDQDATQALGRLARAEELARYAAKPDLIRWVDQNPRADEVAVRKALFGSVTRTRRLRAHFAPSSTVHLIGAGGAWASDRIQLGLAAAQAWVRTRTPSRRDDDGQGDL
jgi:transglutaminase-like putative cysteine protease